jgi:hypothetical protein
MGKESLSPTFPLCLSLTGQFPIGDTTIGSVTFHHRHILANSKQTIVPWMDVNMQVLLFKAGLSDFRPMEWRDISTDMHHVLWFEGFYFGEKGNVREIIHRRE